MDRGKAKGGAASQNQAAGPYSRPTGRLPGEGPRDHYGRIVAIYRASNEDLGAIMVREGLAWAFVLPRSDPRPNLTDRGRLPRVHRHTSN